MGVCAPLQKRRLPSLLVQPTRQPALIQMLDRYIARVVIRAFLMLVLGLTALFSLLAFVEQLSFVGQGHYELHDALIYTLLTAPSRILQIAPIAMLLGTLVGLGALAKHSELTAFRSFGISQARIIGAALKLCIPIIIGLFCIAQFIIPPAQQVAQREQAAALGDALPGLSNGGFWAQKNGVFLNVQSYNGSRVMRGVSIFVFGPQGALETLIQAESATPQPDGAWQLEDVTHYTVLNHQTLTTFPKTLTWKPFLTSRQLTLLSLPPQTMPPLALYKYVRQLKRQHQEALIYEQTFWNMVAIPLSLIGMVLIAGPFIFGSQRSGGTGRQLVIGALIGMSFVLIQQITGYLGLLLDLRPAFSALAPSLLLLAIGGWFLERGQLRAK